MPEGHGLVQKEDSEEPDEGLVKESLCQYDRKIKEKVKAMLWVDKGMLMGGKSFFP